MGSVYVYEADADDFSTIGICGALTPISCTFNEIANGASSVQLEHPIDELNRYACLRENRILKCDVPVRTTPEIANGEFVTVIEKYIVKKTATKEHRYLFDKANPAAKKQKKLKLVPVGSTVAVVAKYANEDYRWKVKCTWQEKRGKKKIRKTATGFIDHDSTTLALEETVRVSDTSTGIEEVAPSWRIEEQLFRIISVEKTEKAIHVEANHISYDLMYNMTNYSANGSKTLQEAADGMLNACFDAHDFTFQTNIKGTKQGFHLRDKDPITALLDPEIGLVSRWGGELIRDNFSFTVLDHAGINRGTMFTYGKNVKGITVNIDFSSVATAIRPVGETESGKPIYMAKSHLWDGENDTTLEDTNGILYGRWHYLDGNAIECRLPHARIFPLEGEECTENKKEGPDVTVIRRRLLDQAIAELKSGAEDPDVSVKVDMQLLGYTQQWDMYRELEKVFLFDTVRVRHPGLGIDLETPVSGIEWDCIEDMPLSITTGAIHDMTSSIASWQVSSLNGVKLIPGSVTARSVGDNAIHTEALAAESVTANKLAAGAAYLQALEAIIAAIKALTADDITAGTVETNTLAAAFAHLFELVAEQIRAGSVTADTLSAVMASMVSASVGTLDVGYAHIKDLDADEAIITDGVAGALLIERLVATSAMMASATLGELVVKGEDGKYYEVAIQAGGTIGTREVTVTEGEIAAGQTAAGRRIVETEADIQSLNATDVRAQSAVIASIFTSALTAGRITAGQALISSLTAPELYVTAIKALGDTIDISANRSISLQLGAANDVRRWIGFDNASGMTVRKPAYTDDNGVEHDRSKWYTVTDEVGFHVFHEDVAGPVGSFHEEQLDVRNLQIGEIVARRTASGGWVWTE